MERGRNEARRTVSWRFPGFRKRGDLHCGKIRAEKCIMGAIMEKAGLTSKAGTIVFSLPVTSTAGLRILEDEEENS